jgi:hypothetical protein
MDKPTLNFLTRIFGQDSRTCACAVLRPTQLCSLVVYSCKLRSGMACVEGERRDDCPYLHFLRKDAWKSSSEGEPK